MKKNILITVLTILIVIFLGIIVYTYKVKPNNNSNNSYSDKNGIKSLSDYPLNNDNDVKTYYLEDLVTDSKIDLNTNFKKTAFTSKNGIKYSLTCTDYLENNSNNGDYEQFVNCDNVKIEVEGFNTSFDYSPNEFGCGNASYILLANNYLINQASSGCGDGGPITVYDKDGRKVFEEEYSEYMYNDVGQLKIKNNVLYYLTYPDWNSDKLYFTSYDLSTNEKKVIETIEARPSGGKN